MLSLQEISARSSHFDPDAGSSLPEAGHPACKKGDCKTTHCPLLGDAGKAKAFAKGDVIFWDGDQNDSLYLIVSGVVRGSKLLSDGRRQICRFAFPGEILEYARKPQFPYTAEAITPVRAVAIPRHHLERTMNRIPCLRRLIMQVVLEELHDTRDQVLALGRLSATERVVHFLHNLARHMGADQDGAFELPMSRLDIADYLGLTIETVSRVISRLKREGKIRLLSSNRIAITDLDDFADELSADAA